MRFLNINNKLLIYANEAVLPFYILHMTILMLIAFFVVKWNPGIGAKFGIITLFSFLAIMAIYDLIRRFNRFNAMRFLFGMKLRKKLVTEEDTKKILEEAEQLSF